MKIELDTDHAGGQVLSRDRSLDFRDLLLSSKYPEVCLYTQLPMLAYFMCYVTGFSPQSVYKVFPTLTFLLLSPPSPQRSEFSHIILYIAHSLPRHSQQLIIIKCMLVISGFTNPSSN